MNNVFVVIIRIVIIIIMLTMPELAPVAPVPPRVVGPAPRPLLLPPGVPGASLPTAIAKCMCVFRPQNIIIELASLAL